MLLDILKNYVGDYMAPFTAVALFVVVVGVSLWLTPRLAKWIDAKRTDAPGFYDGMHSQPPENDVEE